jgi:LCP family protein required for cell wall assembly
MADRPRGSGGPEEGTPEYNWLYGKKGSRSSADDATRATQRRPRPEETRVMPAVPAERGSARSSGRPTPPTRPPAGSARTSQGSRFPRPKLRWLLYLLVLWLVFLIAIPLWAWSRVEKVDAFPADDARPDEQPGTTYLVVGSDQADDLTEEQQKAVRAGERSGQRTDTMMLLHVGDGPSLLMSIPRDTPVEIPGHGTAKVNGAYAFGGPSMLVRTLEGATGIRIDHYVEIGFGGVINMVDAVGGVEICPETAMNDPDARLKIDKGCQEADGLTALAYARSRKTSSLGDLDRARRQREVVSAVGSKVVSPWTIVNPLRYYRVNMAAADAVRVSEGTSSFSMARFAWAMTRVGSSGLTCTTPITAPDGPFDPERSKAMFQAVIEDDTDSIGKALCTPTGLAR